MRPRLLVGPLSHRIFLVTRYRELEGGVIEAIGEKVDVTNDVGAAIAELARRGFVLADVTDDGEEATT